MIKRGSKTNARKGSPKSGQGPRESKGRRSKGRRSKTVRPIVIHSLAHAEAALGAAAALGVGNVTLLSAPFASAGVGPGWFSQTIAQAGAAYPGIAIEAIFDCGDRPGHALAALRAGIKAVSLRGRRDATARIAAIAARSGGRLVPRPKGAALDLLTAQDPAAACRAWLEEAARGTAGG